MLTPEQHQTLEVLARSADSPAVRRRAQILLLYHASKGTREIAGAVGLSMSRVQYWRRRFRREGMAIFPAQGADSPVEPSTPTVPAGMPADTIPTRRKKKERAPSDPEGIPDKLRMGFKAVVRKSRTLLGKEAAGRIKKVRSLKGARKLVRTLASERKRIRRSARKKKKSKGLKTQLKALDKQIKRAEILLEKLEKRARS